MKKLFLGLILVMMFSVVSFADVDYTSSADKLNELGLFAGTQEGYELDRAPTRLEGAVMLIRLMGVEGDVKTGDFSHPFTDVPEWADAYIGYMYENGLTTGVSATKFDSSSLMSGNAYGTFVLRALGYDDTKGDFTWDTSLELLASKGVLTESEKVFMSGTFRRNEMVGLSYNALSAKLKDSNMTLEESLGLVDNRLFARDEDLVGTVTAKQSDVEGFYQVDRNELSKLVGDFTRLSSSGTNNNDNLDSHISRLFVSEKDKEKYREWYKAYGEGALNQSFSFRKDMCIVMPILDTNFDVNYYMYLDSRVQQGIDGADVEVNVYKMSDEILELIDNSGKIYAVEYARLSKELIEYKSDQFEFSEDVQAIVIKDEVLMDKVEYYSAGNTDTPADNRREFVIDDYLIGHKIWGLPFKGRPLSPVSEGIDKIRRPDHMVSIYTFYDVDRNLIGYTIIGGN